VSEAYGRGGPDPTTDGDGAVVVRGHQRGGRLRLVAPTLLAIVAVAIAAALGWWQLEAWQERRAAEARDLTQLDPVPLVEVMGPDDPFPGNDVGRPVTIEGEWLPQGLFFVSGRELDGRDGFWPVVPLAVGAPGDPAIPVVLGWTESTGDVVAPTGPGAVTGWLQPPDGNGSVDDDPDDDVVPQLRTADAIQRVENDLYSAYVISTEPTSGMSRASLDALPPVGRFTALRNLLYALEWWVFGAFAAFIWWRWVRDEEAPGPVTDSPT
jgi:cytochrome oxidase assembly protein ShyY1